MGKLIDLTGNRFGFWVVLEKTDNNKSGKTQWLCKCECGIIKSVTSNSLRTGNSTSCGCNHTPNLIDFDFKKFTVLEKQSSNGRRYWLCKCKCGNMFTETTHKLRNNITTSCDECSFKTSKCNDRNYSMLIKNLNTLQENVKLIQEKAENAVSFSKTAHENLISLKEMAFNFSKSKT